jgi:hypothetical protein
MWWKSKWAIAGNIAVSYIGVAYYVNALVRKEIEKRDMSYSDDNRPSKAEQKTAAIPQQLRECDNRETFNRLAEDYDSKLRWDERIMGLTILRRLLLRHSKVLIYQQAGAGAFRYAAAGYRKESQ